MSAILGQVTRLRGRTDQPGRCDDRLDPAGHRATKDGQTITRPAPWTWPVLFARESCTISVNVAAQTFAARVETRSFMMFPPTGSGAFTTENFEDDGESEAYKTGGYGGWHIKVEADAKSVSVRVQRFGAFRGLDPEAHHT